MNHKISLCEARIPTHTNGWARNSVLQSYLVKDISKRYSLTMKDISNDASTIHHFCDVQISRSFNTSFSFRSDKMWVTSNSTQSQSDIQISRTFTIPFLHRGQTRCESRPGAHKTNPFVVQLPHFVMAQSYLGGSQTLQTTFVFIRRISEQTLRLMCYIHNDTGFVPFFPFQSFQLCSDNMNAAWILNR